MDNEALSTTRRSQRNIVLIASGKQDLVMWNSLVQVERRMGWGHLLKQRNQNLWACIEAAHQQRSEFTKLFIIFYPKLKAFFTVSHLIRTTLLVIYYYHIHPTNEETDSATVRSKFTKAGVWESWELSVGRHSNWCCYLVAKSCPSFWDSKDCKFARLLCPWAEECGGLQVHGVPWTEERGRLQSMGS